MRLLDTHTGKFIDRDPEDTKYAILSHTWNTEKGEQTYEQLKKIQQCYNPGSQTPQSLLNVAETDGASHRVVQGESPQLLSH